MVTKSCADPEIFMRGGPTKMVIFGHRRGGGGGPTPQKNPEITLFKVKFPNSGGPDQIPGGGVRTPGPPSGSAHENQP